MLEIVYFVLAVLIIWLLMPIFLILIYFCGLFVSLLTYFIYSHILITVIVVIPITTLLAIILQNLPDIKKYLSKNSIKYALILISMVLYFCLNWIIGSSSSILSILFKASPVKIVYEYTGSFPILKTLSRRIWFDLPLKKVPFAGLQWSATADYYGSNNEINESKKLVCILRNMGQRPLLLKKINKLVIYRDDYIFDNDYFFTTINGERISGLIEISDFINKNKPIILFPNEETVILSLNPACTIEKLKIETEIIYCEYQNEKIFYKYYETCIIDTSKFKKLLFKTLFFETIDYLNKETTFQQDK